MHICVYICIYIYICIVGAPDKKSPVPCRPMPFPVRL